MKNLITIQEAYDRVMESVSALGTEELELSQAYGRVLAGDIFADRPIPPYDQVMMDGIAISYDSFLGGTRHFTIAGTQSAGMPALSLAKPDECLEVMTGAPLPSGTDTVIKIEDIKHSKNLATITHDLGIEKGQHVHPIGSDQQTGTSLVNPNSLLGAAELAIAASVGRTQVTVYKSPSILLITTGDEVVSPEKTPETYQIRRSHSYAIRASIESHKLGKVTHVHVPDTEEDLKNELVSGAKKHDVILLTGGISKGKFDYVAPVMGALVGEACFHGVAQRPGKPFAFWNRQNREGCKTPVFALPGNPVSVMACLARYILPALRKMRGECWKPQQFPLSQDFVWNAPFPGLAACRIWENKLLPSPPRNSGDYTALAGCLGICKIESSSPAGKLLTFYPW